MSEHYSKRFQKSYFLAAYLLINSLSIYYTLRYAGNKGYGLMPLILFFASISSLPWFMVLFLKSEIKKGCTGPEKTAIKGYIKVGLIMTIILLLSSVSIIALETARKQGHIPMRTN